MEEEEDRSISGVEAVKDENGVKPMRGGTALWLRPESTYVKVEGRATEGDKHAALSITEDRHGLR